MILMFHGSQTSGNVHNVHDKSYPNIGSLSSKNYGIIKCAKLENLIFEAFKEIIASNPLKSAIL